MRAAVVICSAALLGIVGCDGDPPVAYDVTELGTSEGEASLVVEVPQAYTKPQLREVFDKVRAENSEPDQGVFVAIKCQTGNHEAGADHLAYGRYAVGEVGRRYTGLAPGQADFTVLEGRTCAPRSPEEEARANSPAQRADAYAWRARAGSAATATARCRIARRRAPRAASTSRRAAAACTP